jgi:large subunit ribosomal protein L24
MKLKKGDHVKVMAGKERGKSGKIVQVFVKEGRVVVEGLNKATKHAKTRKQKGSDKGQKIEFFAPMPLSSVMLICPKCSKPTRAGYKVLEDGKKVRICKKCKSTIE